MQVTGCAPFEEWMMYIYNTKMTEVNEARGPHAHTLLFTESDKKAALNT